MESKRKSKIECRQVMNHEIDNRLKKWENHTRSDSETI